MAIQPPGKGYSKPEPAPPRAERITELPLKKGSPSLELVSEGFKSGKRRELSTMAKTGIIMSKIQERTRFYIYQTVHTAFIRHGRAWIRTEMVREMAPLAPVNLVHCGGDMNDGTVKG